MPYIGKIAYVVICLQPVFNLQRPQFFVIIIWMLTVNFDVHMMCVKIIICKKYEC